MIVREVAELAQVKPGVVRYYTRIGLLSPSRNPENGYHQYSPRDVKRVCFIRKAKWLGFTLKDAKTILAEADAGKSPCRKVRKIIGDRIVENQQRMEQLQQVQARMEDAVAAWAVLSDSAPGNENICGLIDNVDCNEEMLDLCAGHKL